MIDTNDYTTLTTKVEAAAVAFSGNLYFEDEAGSFKKGDEEELYEDRVENLIGMRVDGKEVDITDIEEVAYEDLHRSYRCYLDTERFFPDEAKWVWVEIEPYSKDEKVPLVFTPKRRFEF